jgi:hypothetical protein
MKAIVVATRGSKSLPVMLASINAYVPNDVVVYLAGDERWGVGRHIRCFPNTATNYGDAYNAIVHEAFKYHDEIIVANDDIVLTPTSYDILKADVDTLKQHHNLGWVVARADYVRPAQIAANLVPNSVYPISRCSPLFGYVTKQAWVNYPPINWYSDDIQCMDMENEGHKHFISRCYVHHAGSQTVGMDHTANHLAAQPWIKDNRPELHKAWFK